MVIVLMQTNVRRRHLKEFKWRFVVNVQKEMFVVLLGKGKNKEKGKNKGIIHITLLLH